MKTLTVAIKMIMMCAFLFISSSCGGGGSNAEVTEPQKEEKPKIVAVQTVPVGEPTIVERDVIQGEPVVVGVKEYTEVISGPHIEQ